MVKRSYFFEMEEVVCQEDSRGDGSPHVVSLPGEVECLDAGGPVALEAQKVDDIEELGRQQGDGQVKDAVAEAHRRHQPFHRGGGQEAANK